MDKKTFSLFSFFLFFILTATSTLAIPTYSGAALSIANASQYAPHRTAANSYGFQIKWNNTLPAEGTEGGVDTIANATFECNFNSTTLNFTSTVVNNTAGIYWINFTYGVNISTTNTLYTYKWYSANTSNIQNKTASTTYYIAKNTSVPVRMNITAYAIGGASTDYLDSNAQSYQGQGNPYADCWMYTSNGTGGTYSTTFGLFGTTYLYRDEATWTKGSTGATSLSAALYTVKCNSTGNANYTDNSTGSSYTLSILASGGGGGGEPLPTTVPTTTQPWQPIGIPEGWNIDSKWIWIGVILIVIYAFSKRKK